MEMHGGALNAHSDGEGKGSVFFMELPLFLRKKDDLSDPSDQCDDLCENIDHNKEPSKQEDMETTLGDSEFLLFNDTKDCQVLRSSTIDLAETYCTADSKFGSAVNPYMTTTTVTKKKTARIRAPPQLGLPPKKRPSTSRRSFSGLSAEHKVFIAEQDSKEWRAGLNILIVDDSLTNRKVMMKLLTSYG